MELNNDKSLIDKFKDTNNNKHMIIPKRLSFSNNEDSSTRTSCVSTTSSLQFCPASPENPWTRSSPLTATAAAAPPPPPPPSSPVFHCLASLHHSQGKIFSIAASKDYIFTGSKSRTIHAWRLPDCIEIGRIKASAGEIRALLAINKLLFTIHGDHKIRVWDIPSTAESFQPRKIATLPRRSLLNYSRTLNKHTDCVSCMCYNHLEKLLYTGSWDRTVKVWKITEKQCIDSFIAHDGHVNAIVINQESGCVFTASSDGTIKIWRRIYQTSSHILTVTLKFEQSPVNALALSESFLYSGSSDGLVNFWEKESTSGRYNHGGFLQGHQFGVLCLVAIEDLILSGSEDSTIRIWKREEGSNSLHTCVAVMEGHHGPVKCLDASLESEDLKIQMLVYSAGFDQTFKVWCVKVWHPCPKIELKKKGSDDQRNGCHMSPILSPSWVERRINGSLCL